MIKPFHCWSYERPTLSESWLYTKTDYYKYIKQIDTIVSYRKTYLARKITLNKIHSDFVESYMNLILFLEELKLHDYDTTIQLVTISKNYFFTEVFGLLEDGLEILRKIYELSLVKI